MCIPRRPSMLILTMMAMLGSGTAGGAETWSAAQPALDPISTGCLACHDGTKGARATYCLLAKGGDGAGGHVISIDYAAAAGRNRGLRPPSDLPATMVLHRGEMTCATCHGLDPHNGAPLAMDNADSALCRACHLK